jgi:hypothetical protein
MNTHTQTFQDINRGNPISDLLDMLARRGPQLMRQGGGALSREQVWSGNRLTVSDRQRIRGLYNAGKTLKEISAITGWSMKTCWNHTRPSDVSSG